MNVKNLRKLTLSISLVAFAIGFSDFRENMFFWMGRPVGAIVFILFLVFTLLEKEFALYDEQERTRLAALNIESPSSVTTKAPRQQDSASRLTPAVSH